MNKLYLATTVLLSCVLFTMAQSPADAYFENAKRLSKERKFSEAAAEIGKAIDLDPNNADLYMRRAGYHRLANDFHSLRADVDRAWVLSHNSEGVLREAVRALDTGDRIDCETMLVMSNVFLQRNPQIPSALDARFRAKSCLGDVAGAFNDISLAVQLAPDQRAHQVNRANLLARLGESGHARELFQEIVSKAESSLVAAEKFVVADQSEPQSEALKHARLVKESWVFELLMLYHARASFYERNGEHPLALNDLSKAVDLRPGDDGPLTLRARFYQRQKKYDEAIADYSQAIASKKKEDFHLLRDRGNVYFQARKYTNAIADFERCLILRPDEQERIRQRIEAVRSELAKKKN